MPIACMVGLLRWPTPPLLSLPPLSGTRRRRVIPRKLTGSVGRASLGLDNIGFCALDECDHLVAFAVGNLERGERGVEVP